MNTLAHTAFTRRSVLGSASSAGLAAAAAPLALFAGSAKASTRRGIVGDRATDSSLVDMIKLLPEGIGVVPVYLNLTQGSREEYGSSYATYEKLIAYLASQKCSVISIEGAPPFMLLGPAREAEMVDGWKRKYNTDMFTSSQNQVNAFKALKVKKILGVTSGSGGPDMNKVYAKYFEDSGIGASSPWTGWASNSSQYRRCRPRRLRPSSRRPLSSTAVRMLFTFWARRSKRFL
jgi:hypothetical protein